MCSGGEISSVLLQAVVAGSNCMASLAIKLHVLPNWNRFNCATTVSVWSILQHKWRLLYSAVCCFLLQSVVGLSWVHQNKNSPNPRCFHLLISDLERLFQSDTTFGALYLCRDRLWRTTSLLTILHCPGKDRSEQCRSLFPCFDLTLSSRTCQGYVLRRTSSSLPWNTHYLYFFLRFTHYMLLFKHPI